MTTPAEAEIEGTTTAAAVERLFGAVDQARSCGHAIELWIGERTSTARRPYQIRGERTIVLAIFQTLFPSDTRDGAIGSPSFA